MMTKVLVCGGRDYENFCKVDEILNELHESQEISLIIQGGASGADELAQDWAYMNQIPCLRVPAKWNKYSKFAGPIRNEQMLTYEPDLVIAFKGGKGTANMKRLASGAKIKVMEIEE